MYSITFIELIQWHYNNQHYSQRKQDKILIRYARERLNLNPAQILQFTEELKTTQFKNTMLFKRMFYGWYFKTYVLQYFRLDTVPAAASLLEKITVMRSAIIIFPNGQQQAVIFFKDYDSNAGLIKILDSGKPVIEITAITPLYPPVYTATVQIQEPYCTTPTSLNVYYLPIPHQAN